MLCGKCQEFYVCSCGCGWGHCRKWLDCFKADDEGCEDDDWDADDDRFGLDSGTKAYLNDL